MMFDLKYESNLLIKAMSNVQNSDNKKENTAVSE